MPSPETTRSDEQIAQEIAGRLRKDWGHDMRHEAGLRWLARCVAEIRREALASEGLAP